MVCETEVVIVRGRADELDLRCGGTAMVPLDAAGESGSPVAPLDDGSLVGKRYVADDDGVEVLCTRSGAGSLSIGEVPLTVKGAKPLPSSD